MWVLVCQNFKDMGIDIAQIQLNVEGVECLVGSLQFFVIFFCLVNFLFGIWGVFFLGIFYLFFNVQEECYFFCKVVLIFRGRVLFR